jgi:glycosyltransferase involved in cell wall biosynthesis
VLVSTSTFPLHLGDGLPRFVYDLCEALQPHCDVTALVPDAPGPRLGNGLGGVEVQRFTYMLPRAAQTLAYGHGMRSNMADSWLTRLQPLPFVLFQARATRRVVERRSIPVVNSHWLIPQGLSSALARGRRARFRHVLSVHAGDVHFLQRRRWGRAVARFVVGRSDVVYVDGTGVRDDLSGLLGRAEPMTVQPMGAHVELFREGPGLAPEEAPFPDGFLLFFGRLVEKKGVVYLLRAMPAILARRPGLGLVVVGYGPELETLRREAGVLGVERSVVFTGRGTHDEIGRYLRSCRAAIVPSVVDRNGETDGMPTVVIEAMSAGALVVASAVDGIPDVVRDADNGWLCRQRDPADLAEKVLSALDDTSASRIRASALRTADGLSWTSVAGRYAAAFASLLGTRVPAGPEIGPSAASCD